MHVNGGRVTWSIGEGDWRIKSYKRWDGQGVREGWFVGCGWGKVFFLYVGATVHESDPQLQATTAAREMGSIQGERSLVVVVVVVVVVSGAHYSSRDRKEVYR
jgi:hypothetical protein